MKKSFWILAAQLIFFLLCLIASSGVIALVLIRIIHDQNWVALAFVILLFLYHPKK